MQFILVDHVAQQLEGQDKVIVFGFYFVPGGKIGQVVEVQLEALYFSGDGLDIFELVFGLFLEDVDVDVRGSDAVKGGVLESDGEVRTVHEVILEVLPLLLNETLNSLETLEYKLQSGSLQSPIHRLDDLQSLVPPHPQNLINHMRLLLLTLRFLTRIIITTDPVIQIVGSKRAVIDGVGSFAVPADIADLVDIVVGFEFVDTFFMGLFDVEEGVD